MTLSDLELYQAELERAVTARNEARKHWEEWSLWGGEKGRQEIYRYTKEKEKRSIENGG